MLLRGAASPLCVLAYCIVGCCIVACEDDAVVSVDRLIDVTPSHLDFGTAELGQDALDTVSIQNLAQIPAPLRAIYIVDDCGGCFLATNPPDLVPGFETYGLTIRFRAVRLATATGTVSIAIADDHAQVHTVTLLGRGSDTRQPDVEVSPSVVDFGFVPAGGVAVSSFVIRSTGTNDLLVDRIRVFPSDAPFRITTSTPTPANPGRLAPGAQASVGLRATVAATATGTVSARVFVETNVVREKNVPGVVGVVAVPLLALANLPPVAIAGPAQTIEPWSRVTLDGSSSHDQDDPPDDPLTFHWEIVQKPGGSRAVLERQSTPFPSFWADLTGRFEIRLTVTDALGLANVEPSTVVVEARPSNAVRIELTWDHPDSDLDLHLVREGGAFCDCASDCHYRDCARAPNWFPATRGSNPRLDIDDRSGFGPENINIDGHGPDRFIQPGAYSIRVHHYSSNAGISSWPTRVSTATVRVFVSGLLAGEFTRALMNDGELWSAATFLWPEGTLTVDGAIAPNQVCSLF